MQPMNENQGEEAEAELAALQQRLQEAPHDPELQREAGRLLGGLGRFREAQAHLERAVRRRPEDAWAWWYLALAAIENNRPGTARKAILGLKAAPGGGAWREATVADLLLRLGDAPGAIHHCQQALALETRASGQGWIHTLLAHGYQSTGDPAAQRRHGEAAVALNPERAVALRVLGHACLQLDDYPAAIDALTRATALDPADGCAWAWLGQAAHRGGRLETARRALEQAVEHGAESVAALADLGSLLLEMDQPAAAVEPLERALECRPTRRQRAFLHDLLGYLHTMARDDGRAIGHYRAAIEADPAAVTARCGLAIHYLRRDQPRLARHHAQKAVALAPEDASAWRVLGSTAMRFNDLLEAREAFDRALRLGHDPDSLKAEQEWVAEQLLRPGGEADAYYLRGNERWGRDDLKGALADFEAAVAAAPGHGRAWQALGFVAETLGKMEQAVASLQTAARLGEDGFETRRNLAWVLYAVNRGAAAIAEGERALAAADDDQSRGVLHALLAFWHAGFEEARAAVAHCDQALAIAPEDPGVQYYAGLTYAELDEPAVAAAHLERACALAPENLVYRTGLAQFCLELEEYRRAETLFRTLLGTVEEAAALAPLVRSLLGQGRSGEARQLAEQAVDRTPPSAPALEALGLALSATGEAERAAATGKRARGLRAAAHLESSGSDIPGGETSATRAPARQGLPEAAPGNDPAEGAGGSLP